VGASTLQLRLTDPGQAAPAARILERVLGHEPVLTPELGGLNVALEAADQAAEALIALRQDSVSIASVSVAKPSLDEVFLALTGHDTHDSHDSQDSQDPDPTDRPDTELEPVR
jgi:ABC-2 type transport system ATP-binding protein